MSAAPKLILALAEEAFGDEVDVWIYGSRIRGETSCDINLYVEYSSNEKPKWNVTNGFSESVSRIFSVKADCIFRQKSLVPINIALVAIASGLNLRGLMLNKDDRKLMLKRGYKEVLDVNMRTAVQRLEKLIDRFHKGEEIKNDSVVHDSFLYELKRVADFSGKSLLRSVIFESGANSQKSDTSISRYRQCEELGAIQSANDLSTLIGKIESYGMDYNDIPHDDRVQEYFHSIAYLNDIVATAGHYVKKLSP